jgi:hypothetical protein
MAKKQDFQEGKNAIRQKINGFSKFLGHVSPIFDDASNPLGHKNTLAS